MSPTFHRQYINSKESSSIDMFRGYRIHSKEPSSKGGLLAILDKLNSRDRASSFIEVRMTALLLLQISTWRDIWQLI